MVVWGCSCRDWTAKTGGREKGELGDEGGGTLGIKNLGESSIEEKNRGRGKLGEMRKPGGKLDGSEEIGEGGWGSLTVGRKPVG